MSFARRSAFLKKVGPYERGISILAGSKACSLRLDNLGISASRPYVLWSKSTIPRERGGILSRHVYPPPQAIVVDRPLAHDAVERRIRTQGTLLFSILHTSFAECIF